MRRLDLPWENVSLEEKGGKKRLKQEADVYNVPQL